MKEIILVLVVIMPLGCLHSPKRNIVYSEPGSSRENVQVINLDTMSTDYHELTTMIEKMHNKGFRPAIQFYDDEVKKSIIPVLPGPDHFREENQILIEYRKALIEEAYLRKRLTPIMNQFYRTSDPDNESLVVLSLHPNLTSTDLRKILINLTRAFDEVKMESGEDSELNVIFKVYENNIPSPPPPPISN